MKKYENVQMARLGNDMKIKLLLELPQNEIIHICENSNSMNKICKTDKYNDLWIAKIRQDFNSEYEGSNAYKEYRFLVELYDRNLYIVNMLDPNVAEPDINTMIFTNLEKALNYLYEALKDEDDEYMFTYDELKKFVDDETLETEGLSNGYYTFFLKREKLYNENRKIKLDDL